MSLQTNENPQSSTVSAPSFYPSPLYGGPPSVNSIFPNEILEKVILLSSIPVKSLLPVKGETPENDGFWWRYTEERKRYPAICTASLVCRRWSKLAQALLWWRVSVDDEDKGERFLNSPMRGKYATCSLEIIGPSFSGVTVETTRRIISGVNGVRELRLEGFREEDGGLDKQTLYSHNLRSLLSLELGEVGIYDASPRDSSTIPYSLRSLTMEICFTTYPSPFSIFSGNSLTSLTLSTDGQEANSYAQKKDVEKLIESAGSRLHDLIIDVPISASTASLLLALSSLQIVCSVAELVAALKSLQSQLKRLICVGISKHEFVSALSPILHIPSLSQLYELRLPAARDEMAEFPGGRELVQTLDRRGVRFTY